MKLKYIYQYFLAKTTQNSTLHFPLARTFDKDKFLVKLDKLHRDLPRTSSVINLMRQEQRY
jgi:hypothetical protein